MAKIRQAEGVHVLLHLFSLRAFYICRRQPLLSQHVNHCRGLEQQELNSVTELHASCLYQPTGSLIFDAGETKEMLRFARLSN